MHAVEQRTLGQRVSGAVGAAPTPLTTTTTTTTTTVALCLPSHYNARIEVRVNTGLPTLLVRATVPAGFACTTG